MSSAEEPKRAGRGRPFPKGVSGNPGGRKPGPNRVAELREAITSVVPQILVKLARQAIEGDVSAARLLLERTVPVVKAVELPVSLPAAFGKGTLSDRGRQILEGVAAGEIPLSQAGELLAGLVALSKIIETDELARRVGDLERAGLKAQPGDHST